MADRVEKYAGESVPRQESNLRALADELSYVLMMPVAPADLEEARVEAIGEKAESLAESAYRRREQEFGPEVMRELERHVYLFTLDEHWREHLHELDHLKGGIGLRAYGQKRPAHRVQARGVRPVRDAAERAARGVRLGACSASSWRRRRSA